MPRHANHGAIRRHVFHHYRATADLRVIADGDRAEHRSAHAHHHVVAKGRVALASFLASAAQRDILVEHAIIADDSGLTDDHAHRMVDEETAADLCARVNLNTRPKTCALRKIARQSAQALLPEPVIDHVRPACLKAGIGEPYEELRRRRWVGCLNGANVFCHC